MHGTAAANTSIPKKSPAQQLHGLTWLTAGAGISICEGFEIDLLDCSSTGCNGRLGVVRDEADTDCHPSPHQTLHERVKDVACITLQAKTGSHRFTRSWSAFVSTCGATFVHLCLFVPARLLSASYMHNVDRTLSSILHVSAWLKVKKVTQSAGKAEYRRRGSRVYDVEDTVTPVVCIQNQDFAVSRYCRLTTESTNTTR
jgi:hypothetical protein